MQWFRGAAPEASEISKKLRTLSSSDNSYAYRLSLKGPTPFQCNIASSKVKDFWTMLIRGELTEEGYSLHEEVADSTPVVCDFIFSYVREQENPLPTAGISAIINCFHNLQTDHYLTTITNAERYCVVLSTDQYEKNGYWNVYVRFQFPYWRVCRNEVNSFIRPRVIDGLLHEGVVKDFPNGFASDWNTTFQTFSFSFSMYGQPPEAGHLPFTEMEIYEPRVEEDASYIESISGNDIFLYGGHGHIAEGTLPRDFCAEMDEEDINYLLLSVRYHPCILMRKNDPTAADVKTEYIDVDMDAPLEMCKILLPAVNASRFQDEVYWKIIGECIYNSCRGKAEGLALWIEHTNRMPRMPHFEKHGSAEDTCRAIYYSFHTSYHTVRTLAWWIRSENPRFYKEWHCRWIMCAREEAMDASDFSISSLIYRNFWLEYAYDEDNNVWYTYDDGRWYGSKGSSEFSKKISTVVARQFVDKLAECLALEPESLADDGKRGRKESGASRALKTIIHLLKSTNSKRNYLFESRSFFFIRNFAANLNKQKNIIGVMNGTVELREHGHFFRPSIPEDYVTMCFTVPYEYMSFQHHRVRSVLDWTSRMYPIQELHHYMWKFFGSVLQAGNAEKIFPIFTGDGNNSKSMLMEILAIIMAARLVKMPVAILTENPRNSNSTSATPALARMADALLALTEECESNVELKAAIVKKYTGGDRFYARKLNENGGDIQLTVKFGLVCNNVPVVANADPAVRNRLRILPHLSTWSKNAPASEEEQWKYRIFPMDPHFSSRLESMAPAFFWLMCQGYDFYKREGLEEPQIITEYTNKYWLTNDFYATYISENIEMMQNLDKSPDYNYHVEVSALYRNFREWFVGFRAGVALPDRSTFVTEMSKKWNKPVESKWYAVRLRMSNQETGVQGYSFDQNKASVPSYVPQQLPTAPRQGHL